MGGPVPRLAAGWHGVNGILQMADGAGLSIGEEFGGLKDFLAIDTPFADGEIVLTSLDGEDALSRCFLYRVTVVTKAHGAAMESLVGAPVTLWLSAGGTGPRRPLNGYVRRARGLGRSPRGGRRFLLEVVPRLWFLSCTLDCRVFQHKNVPAIIKEIFEDCGLRDFKFRLAEQDYPVLEYCVQYQESALHFISRLMEQFGMFYWHEHTADTHLLIIAASNRATGKCEPYDLHINPHAELGELQTLEIDNTFRPGKWTLNDYDFQSPTKQLLVDTPTLSDAPLMADCEIYEYPGNFTDPDAGRRLTRLRIEMEEAQHRRVDGMGSVVSFDPGLRFQVENAEHGRDAYLLTEVRHHAKWSGRETGAEEFAYANEYVAIPARAEFRPERLTPRPVIHGTQTATVVGPTGENIYCDEYGRVRVQFHWDRRGKRNENSSCWLRVAQQSAGSYWGGIATPHVGQEVIVSFLNGDPDHPMVTGLLHNAINMPPLNLPQDKNKMIQRDHGDNKFVMQGLAGKQSISLASPRTVNIIAMRQPAKALSAQVSPGVGPDFDNGLDTNAFDQLQSDYTAMRNPPPPEDGGNVNTVSDGEINSLSLGNVNNWVGRHLKQEVMGVTYTKSHGSVVNVYESEVQNRVIGVQNDAYATMHSEETDTHIEVTAIHAEATVAHVESTELLHIEHAMGWHFESADFGKIETSAQKASAHEKENKDTKELIAKIDSELKTSIEITQIAQNVTELTASLHQLKATTYALVAINQINISCGLSINIKAISVNIN